MSERDELLEARNKAVLLERELAAAHDEIASLQHQLEASVAETREARDAVRAQAALLARTLIP